MLVTRLYLREQAVFYESIIYPKFFKKNKNDPKESN